MSNDLLTRVRAGDPEAQEEARRNWLGGIRAVCRRMLSDRQLADELAEDIWMDFALDHIDKVRKPEALQAYLRMMTIRRCARARQLARRHEPWAEAMRDEGTDPESEWIQTLDAEKLQPRLVGCMQQLTRRARQVLRMRYHRDMTCAAIGTRLGLSGQYVGRMIAKGLETLRTCMEGAP